MHFRASGVVSTWMRSAATRARSRPASNSARRSVLGPLVGQVRPGAVEGLGHVAQMLLGMVDVDDLDGAGKLLGGDVPNPWSAVADDDLTVRGVEAAPLPLAIDTLCEGGRLRVGVAASRALDRGVVADRPGVADRPALRVAPFGRPHGGQLDLASLGRAVGLLPATPFDLGRAHRHARAVHPEVQRGRGRRCGLLGDGCARRQRPRVRAPRQCARPSGSRLLTRPVRLGVFVCLIRNRISASAGTRSGVRARQREPILRQFVK